MERSGQLAGGTAVSPGRDDPNTTECEDLELLERTTLLQHQHESRSCADHQKEKGQFFTPPSVAEFMAGLFSNFPKRFSVLDPGAGFGTLSAAICQRVKSLKSPRTVHFVLYETDQAVLHHLENTMIRCRQNLKKAGHEVTYDIRNEDFILTNPNAFKEHTLFDRPGDPCRFDVAIMNPPYFKIHKSSDYARIMHRVVHGQPNIYALFMALAAEMLRPGGELVAITPRSFCSGFYFRGFRRWFLERMSLRHIHLFESRKDTFRSANVLQESVITCAVKTANQAVAVTVTTSIGPEPGKRPAPRRVSAAQIIDDANGDCVIRIPERNNDVRVMELVESWPQRFADHDLRVSTGPIVTFRAREFLLHSQEGSGATPLLSLHNVRPFETVWPVEKNGKPIAFKVCAKSLARRLLVPRSNYVLLRRFSAKEERRRLTASCYMKEEMPAPHVALENHLNYVYHARRELTAVETLGLAALFNSALMDRYFRTLSGNTQVNARDILSLNWPSLKSISQIGRRGAKLAQRDLSKMERIVMDVLGVNENLRSYLMEFTR